MMKPTKFKDSSIAPIMAMDFDGTINIGNVYPKCGQIRPYVKEVMNFLVDIGVKVVIWTSRDVAINQDRFEVFDDLSVMVEYLNNNGVKYSAINKSVQFAPFHYNGRKIYAHMYVDDRAFGWCEHDEVMLHVLASFMSDVLNIESSYVIDDLIDSIRDHRMEDINYEYFGNVVQEWR